MDQLGDSPGAHSMERRVGNLRAKLSQVRSHAQHYHLVLGQRASAVPALAPRRVVAPVQPMPGQVGQLRGASGEGWGAHRREDA